MINYTLSIVETLGNGSAFLVTDVLSVNIHDNNENFNFILSSFIINTHPNVKLLSQILRDVQEFIF